MHANKEIDYVLEKYKTEVLRVDEKWPVKVKEFANYIHRHLFDLNLTIMSAYKQCNISDKNFSGKFSAFTGYTPKNYLLYHRIECSKQILQQDGKNDLTLIMVAMKLGFSSHSTFTRAFKSRTGMTPSQWIAENNQGNS